MINKKFFLMVLTCLLVMTSFVSAGNDVYIDQTFNADTGLQIEYPAFNYGLINTNLTMSFHVFNLSNGFPLTTGLNCSIHIYDGYGDHLLIAYQDEVSDSVDFNFYVNDSVFPIVGAYYFVTFCQHETGVGGFASHYFEINNEGFAPDNGYSSIIFILAIFLFSWIILKVAINLDIEHTLLKVLFFIVSLIMSFSGLAFGLAVLNSVFLPLAVTSSATTIYKISLWSFRLFASYIMIYYIWKVFKYLSEVVKK